MNEVSTRHPDHVWHQRADGRVRCAEQNCPAQPSPGDIQRAARDQAQAAALRVDLDYRPAVR